MSGRAGASAQREHQRRKAKREAGVRARHPRLGGVILALQNAPQHETSWSRGAGGEQLVEQALTKRCPTVTILHDHAIPGSRANIDHIAVTTTGVWVIDTKRYKGKVQIAKPLFGKPTLKIAGRDKTGLVDSLAKQVDLVSAAIADVDSLVPVHGCFCFVDSELPVLGTPSIHGFTIFGRKGLAKQLNASGALPADRTATLAAALAERFPSA
jgi:hypothetical protein